MTSIGFLVFPGIQLLDLIGPYEIFAALPDCQLQLIWKTTEPIACSAGMEFHPTTRLADATSIDVLCIPGGVGINALLTDAEILEWIRTHAATAQFITSVCTGSLLLGTAGLLRGKRATTHWRYHDLLSLLGAIPIKERIVQDGNLITGGGVTAGIDFGLTVVAALRGQSAAEEVQLALEYTPKPPFPSGSPDSAPASILSAVLNRTQALYEERRQIITSGQPIAPDHSGQDDRQDDDPEAKRISAPTRESVDH